MSWPGFASVERKLVSGRGRTGGLPLVLLCILRVCCSCDPLFNVLVLTCFENGGCHDGETI
jgi:hypothetical protein